MAQAPNTHTASRAAPQQEPDDLFETISQVLLSAVNRDAFSGWGAVVYIMYAQRSLHLLINLELVVVVVVVVVVVALSCELLTGRACLLLLRRTPDEVITKEIKCRMD